MFGRLSISRKLLAPTLAAALLGAAFVTSTPEAIAQHASQPVQSEHPAKKLVSVDFAGGTTQQYYDALQKALGQNVVVIMPGTDTVVMPPVKLTNVPFGEAVQVAKYVQGPVAVDVRSEGQTWVVMGQDVRQGRTASLIQTHTWPIAEIIQEGTSAEALLSAVQAGLDLYGAGAQVKYHDETKVLFARGTTDELELIKDTLRAAGESAWAQRRGEQDHGEDIEARIERLEAVVAELKAALKTRAR